MSDRQLRKVHKRLQKARERLALAEAELSLLAEQSDEDVVRALVSDGGMDRAEASESRKHSERARREVEALHDEVGVLQRQLDDLLDRR